MQRRLEDRIASWIADQVKEAGAKGAVLGLSGGLDSAVVAALCKKGLGENVLGAVLPCESVPADEADAKRTADALGLLTETIRLDESYRALLSVLPEGPSVAAANLKARLRMTALYHIARARSFLVVGTGNKSEIMAGYFTKYGDGGSDLLPLGNLTKTEVRLLATDLKIPKVIIDKPPSAGLWPGQTDEAELGIAYAELDQVLEAIASGMEEKIGPGILKKAKALISASEHKRRLPPVFKP